ncbi:hypothetical protein MAR_025438 [Mya arenaria]|uniref:Uncharacterized protein n=1 Tax=Mya arenaria TaxID=6604 RepID=A0ABY7DXN7_MYAAR|nr:hypothetical protein MAR_025438 [Mya arenaria]
MIFDIAGGKIPSWASLGCHHCNWARGPQHTYTTLLFFTTHADHDGVAFEEAPGFSFPNIATCGADSSIQNTDGLTAEDTLRKERPDGWEENLHWFNKFRPGLWCALNCENPDRKLVESLLKNWCRVTTVKNGKVTTMKVLVENDIKKRDLLQLIEKYENTNELALATTAGMGFIVRMWLKQGTCRWHLNKCKRGAQIS